MNLFHRLFILGLLCLTLASSDAVNGQKRTLEDLLKEAGRIITDAERANGEAFKKAEAARDRKIVRDAQKFTAEKFEIAIELWREAGHDERLKAGVEELTRLYLVLGEFDRVVDRLTREAEYWREHGNVVAQTESLYTLAIRQSQMNRDAVAIETYERALALTRSARLRSLEPNVLNQLAFSYERVGRVKDAELSRETANKLWGKLYSEPRREPIRELIPPATIPSQWVDLPGAPAAAEYRVIEGVNEAVLINRSTKVLGAVMFGCVALEGDGKVRVLHGLIGEGRSHGGVGPGRYFQPFLSLNGPLNRWTDEKMGCEGEAKMTLIKAMFDDHTDWKADGIDWTK